MRQVIRGDLSEAELRVMSQAMMSCAVVSSTNHMSRSADLLTVIPAVQVKSLQELVELARRAPGRVLP